jgi:hypothetical protein
MLADHRQSGATGDRESYVARLAKLEREIAPFRELLGSLAQIDRQTEHERRSQAETAIKSEFRKLVARLPDLASETQSEARRDLPIEAHYVLWAELLSRPVQTGLNKALGRGLVLDLWDIWVTGAVGEDLAEGGGPDEAAAGIIRPSVIRDLLGTVDSIFADLLGDKKGFPIATVEAAALEMARVISQRHAVDQPAPLELRAVLYALLRLERQCFQPEAQAKGATAILNASASLQTFETSLGENAAPPDYSAAIAGIETGEAALALSSEAYSVLLFLSGRAASDKGEYSTSTMAVLVGELVPGKDAGIREGVSNLLAYWAARHPLFGYALTDLFGHRFWTPQQDEGPPASFPSPSVCDLWVTVFGPRQVGKTSFMYATRAALSDSSPETAGLAATINPFEFERPAIERLSKTIADNRENWENNKGKLDTASGNHVVAAIDTPFYCRLQFFDVAGELLWEPKDQAPKPELVEHVKDRQPRAVIFFDANGSDDMGAKYEKIIRAVFVENGDAGPRPPVYIVVNKSDAVVDLYPEGQQDLLYEVFNCDVGDLQYIRRPTGIGKLPFFSLRSFDFASGGPEGAIAKTADGIVASLHQFRGVAQRPLFRHRLALDLRRLDRVIDAFLITGHEDISVIYTCSLSASSRHDHLHPIRELWTDLARRLVVGTAASRRSGLEELLEERVRTNLQATENASSQLRRLSQDSKALDLDTTTRLDGDDPDVTTPENEWASVISQVKQVSENHPLITIGDGIGLAVRNARRFRKSLRTAILELIGEAGIDLSAPMREIVNALPKVGKVEQTTADEHVQEVIEGLRRLAEGGNSKLHADKIPAIEAELKRIMRSVLAKPKGVVAAAPMIERDPQEQPYVRSYTVTKGVEAGTDSLVWEKRLRPSAEAAIGEATESSTIKEFLGWRSDDGAGRESPRGNQLDLINALYGVALGANLRYSEQWLRLGSKDVYQFKVLTDRQQRSARTAYRDRLLGILNEVLETREILSRFDFGRFVDYKMAGAIITYLSAGASDLPTLIAAFAAPAEKDATPRIEQSPFKGIGEKLRNLADEISAFDAVHLQTLHLALGYRSSDGWFETLLGFGRSGAELVSLLNAFQEILARAPIANEVLTRAREKVSSSPWTKQRVLNEKKELPQILLAIDDVRKETLSSHLLVEAAYKAFERIGQNQIVPLAEQLTQFQESFSERLGGVVRYQQFATDIDDLRGRRRYLTLAYATQYIVESAWIEGAADARQTGPSRVATPAGDLQRSISGKILGDLSKQSVTDSEVADITADLHSLRGMMSDASAPRPADDK